MNHNHTHPKKSESGLEISRVLAVHKNSFTLSCGVEGRVVNAELSGRFLYGAVSPEDYPAVGDFVRVYSMMAGEEDGDDVAASSTTIIHEVVKRRSLLKRKTPGKQVDFQIIAANIDTAFIVQALDDDFSLNRIERYMVMINEGNIRPVVLLCKSDLLSPDEVAERIEAIKSTMPQLRVVSFSNGDKSSLETIRSMLESGLTYCLLGSSGVGKTTLLNNLIGGDNREEAFRTNTVREKDGKGRHTTTSRQLITLENGAMIIDTPGMRELGSFSTETGLEATFSEITALAAQCRYRDCSHTNEKECAVLKAVKNGELSRKRYKNFLKMNNESAFHEMSYHQKRQKDKKFGKMVRGIVKDQKKRRG